MAYKEKRIEAVKMRRLGMSYSQIKRELGVSKSTLSLWLRHMPLSVERIRELGAENEQRIDRFRTTMRQKRESRLHEIYRLEKNALSSLTSRELYLAGLMLYWGEGGKTARTKITLSNIDLRKMKFFIAWLIKSLHVSPDNIWIKLHLYSDMNIRKETQFWSSQLEISPGQFKPPYIKKTALRGLTYKTYGHGTCKMIVYSRDLYEKVMMGIQAVADFYLGTQCE